MSFLPSLHAVLSAASKVLPTNNNGASGNDTPTPAGTPRPVTDDPAYDPTLTDQQAMDISTSLTHTREVSMIEKDQKVGVTFTPRLAQQRMDWTLEVLRREGVTSVLDIGCGEGALLNILSQPASSVPEAPIRPASSSTVDDGDDGEDDGAFAMDGIEATNGNSSHTRTYSTKGTAKKVNGVIQELFLHRIAGLDIDATTIPQAVRATAPPLKIDADSSANGNTDASTSSSSVYHPPRWQRLEVEIWQGGLEKHNQRLDGHECIVAMEVIEHLNGPSLAVFPQMVFGTFRPRLVLITTPNFEFNSKFPRVDGDECSGHHNGFLDPTGRTERVFRHSDHKLEMTEAEFKAWCDTAEEWGYTAEISGVGVSNQPSYHDDDPTRPIYASQTAIFRQTGTAPHRSPRSVRSVRLPFMPASGEEFHAHRLAARHVHGLRGPGEVLNKRTVTPGKDEVLRELVKGKLSSWNSGTVSFNEIWAVEEISRASVGSKRRLCRALGGFGDCPGRSGGVGEEADWELFWNPSDFGGLMVRWKAFVGKEEGDAGQQEQWGQQQGETREVEMTDTSGW